MSITSEPNKGLRLKLDRFSPICSWHGGRNFWSHEFQLTVRQGALAKFLPRAVEEDGSVLYELRLGGVELTSTSSPIQHLGEIPPKELQALREAVNELKRKAEDPHCDRTKRQLIESFRLPDPQTDRDLYRLSGKGSDKKLIVLWGVEREEGSSLDPLAATDLMHAPSPDPGAGVPRSRSIALPFVLIAGLALAAGAGWYFKQNSSGPTPQPPQRESSSQLASPSPKTDSSKTTQSPIESKPATIDKPTPDTPPEPAKKPLENGTLASANGGSYASTATQNSLVKPGSLLASGTDKISSPGKPDSVTSGGSGALSAEVVKVGSAASVFPLSAGSSTSGTVTSSGSLHINRTASGSSQTAGSGSGNTTAVPLSSGSVAATGSMSAVTRNSGTSSINTAGSSTRTGTSSTSTGTGSLSLNAPRSGSLTAGSLDSKSSVNGTLNSASTKTGTQLSSPNGVSAGSAAAGSTQSGSLSLTKNKQEQNNRKGAGNSVGSGSQTTSGSSMTTGVNPPQLPTPAPVYTVMTPNGPPPSGISSLSIVSTSLSGLLASGNVEVLLNIVARSSNGAVCDAPPIDEWRVDGLTKRKPDGSVANGPVLPVQLTAGKHTITTIGRGADGKPYRTEAEVIITPK